MALVRKGSRRITVDGTDYRWVIRRRPSYGQSLGQSPLTFAVEDADESGQVLLVTTRYSRPDNCMRHDPGPPVTPAVVANAVRRARRAGWQPSSPGSAHRLDL